jgi:hypothetical protein
MKTAQQWVNELGTGTSQAFPNIKRADMVAGLQARLAAPWTIHQADASLCGPASLMYSLASLKSALYAQYVVELYQLGQVRLGHLSVVPGPGCKKYKPVIAMGRIHPVDWVALASLRDSENEGLFAYDEASDQIGGITLPGKLVDWFKASGFRADANYTNFVVNKDVGCIRGAANRFSQRHTVCLFIDANLILAPTDPFPHIANHWAVMAAPVSIKGKHVTTSLYSWGKIQKVNLPIDAFCGKFYGYVSALV